MATMLTLALALVPEPTPSDEAPTIALEVDLSALPDDDLTKGLAYYLETYQTEVIQHAGLEVADDAALVIRIKISRYGDGDIHSRADVALIDADSGTPQLERTIECELCRDGDLVMKIGHEVSQLSERAMYSPEEPEDEPIEAHDQPPRVAELKPIIEDRAGPPVIEPDPAIGRMGYGGIGALVIGAAGLASGIPLVLQPDEIRVMNTGVEIRHRRSVGLGLACTGSTLLATGVVLLIVDVIKHGKRRRFSVLPGPTMSGVSARGRF